MPAKKQVAAPTKKPAAAAPTKKPLPKAAGKKVAGKNGKKVVAKPAEKVNTEPRITSKPRSFHVGGNILPKGAVDLTRFTRWPRYVWRQRRSRVLQARLKIPPSIHQFSKTLDPDVRKEVFRFAQKYAPESKKERTQRLKAVAAAKAAKSAGKKDIPTIPTQRPQIRTGLKSITRLIEKKRAKLVLIAADVSPIELVIFLPTLCRKMDVPYAIVKGKSLLGKLAGFKEATAIAFDSVKPEDSSAFNTIVSTINDGYLKGAEESRRQWGGLLLGRKSRDKLKLREDREKKARLAVEAATKK
jgi:large subunit ribosomal protein L7Ae